MFTHEVSSAPRIEVEKVERIGEREVETRVVVEGLDPEQMTYAIGKAMRIAMRIAVQENE